MLEMRPGRPEGVPAQKALWKAAFGDEDRYIDWFYECCGGSADVLEVVEEGRLASMLALLPQTLTLPGGGTASGWYIYALATDPGARSKGYGRQLLRFVDGYLAERGADCVTTVPAEPSLFKFFGTVGFAPCFSTRKLELLKSMLQPAAEGDRAEPVEPGEYNAIRRRLLEGAPAVDYPEELIRYQQGMGRLSGGELQRVLLAFALDPLPDLLLLDEPVSAVDRKGVGVFYDLVTSLRSEYHMPVILVSHDLGHVKKYASKAAFLQDGTVAMQNTVDKVLNNPQVREAFGLD